MVPTTREFIFIQCSVVSSHSSNCEPRGTVTVIGAFVLLQLFVVREIISKKMFAYKIIVALAVVIAVVKAQRPFYAGLSPIGYPAVETDFISNRFGEDEAYPIEARGDKNLINRLDTLPVDNQPFWYLNWRQYEDFRRNPQTYPQRQNSFTGGR